ncbi:DUF1349 domain-containing protein, partial [bacterium]|nr:DUF1349 domain-containing protein [bacterium]
VTIEGAGSNIYYANDECYYFYAFAHGDAILIAKLVSQENTSSYAKAGIMFRETLDGGSKQFSTVVNYSTGTRILWRTTTDGSTGQASGSGSAPLWMKAVRVGNTFYGYTSSDGETWTQVDTARTINMENKVCIGLVVSSCNESELCTGVFSDITLYD